MKVLNDITAAPFSVSFFTAGSWEKETEKGAAVTSLRMFAQSDGFRFLYSSRLGLSQFANHLVNEINNSPYYVKVQMSNSRRTGTKVSNDIILVANFLFSGSSNDWKNVELWVLHWLSDKCIFQIWVLKRFIQSCKSKTDQQTASNPVIVNILYVLAAPEQYIVACCLFKHTRFCAAAFCVEA
jgi:hypothetical protein